MVPRLFPAAMLAGELWSISWLMLSITITGSLASRAAPSHAPERGDMVEAGRDSVGRDATQDLSQCRLSAVEVLVEKGSSQVSDSEEGVVQRSG